LNKIIIIKNFNVINKYMTCSESNNYEARRTNEFAMFRSLKSHAWHRNSKNSNLTGYLAANNSGVSDTTRTSGSVVDASDYIRYKKIGAATRNFNQK
tara:strand:+ start:1079 stop:1369 length:291 start_codon:yes stop_codon:yes gene_type:complete